MKSWETKAGTKIFQVLSGRSNSYFIKTNKLNVLVDTGKISSFLKLQHNIRLLSKEHQNIDILILTHTHFDHCQNAANLQNQNACKILMHESEKDYVVKGYTPVPKGTTMISKTIYSLGSKTLLKRFSYEPFSPDILVNDNFQFPEEKINLQIVATPGHSSGSICLIIDDEIALVGDTLFGVFPNSVFPPFADSIPELIKSWSKLLNTNCHTFLPGHGKAINRQLLEKDYPKYSMKVSH